MGVDTPLGFSGLTSREHGRKLYIPGFKGKWEVHASLPAPWLGPYVSKPRFAAPSNASAPHS